MLPGARREIADFASIFAEAKVRSVLSPSIGSGEDQCRVRGNFDARGVDIHAAGRSVRDDATVVAGNPRVREVIVIIAIKNLFPMAGPGEFDRVVVKRVLVEARNYDQVTALTYDPAMHDKDPIDLVHLGYGNAFTFKRRVQTPQVDKVGDKALKVTHVSVPIV